MMKKALKCDFRQEQVHELPMFDCQRTHAAFERSNLEALNKSSLISVQGTLVGYLVTHDIVCPLHQTNKKEQKIKKIKNWICLPLWYSNATERLPTNVHVLRVSFHVDHQILV